MALDPGKTGDRPPNKKEPELDPIQRALQENEDWYRDLVEHSQDLLCIHDLQGRLLSINPAPARVLGYTVEELLQIPMRDIIVPEFREQFDAYLAQIASAGVSRGLMAVQARSGEERIWEYHNTLRTEGVASPIVRGIAHDVTERIKAEKVLRASHERLVTTALIQERTLRELTLFRLLLDQSDDAIHVIEPGTLRLLDVNHQACVELGYSREELLSMTIFDIAPDFDAGMRANVLQQIRQSGSAIIERLHRRRDGTTFPVEVNLREVHLDRVYGIAIARDITARKQAESRHREYARLVEGLDEMILVVDREYRYVLANRAYLQYRCLQSEQVIGHLLSEIVGADFFQNVVKQKIDEALTGKVVRYEKKDTYPNIGEREVSVSYFPIEGPAGIDRIAVVLQDITDRKRADQALRRSEESYRAFVAQSSEGIFRQDLDAPVPIDIPEDDMVRHILYDSYLAECNDAIVKMYGLNSVQDFLGKRLTETVDPKDARNIQLTRDYIRSGFRVVDRESHEIDIRGNPKVFLNSMIGLVENGKLVRTWGIQRDVTERVRLEEARNQAEEALRQSEQRFRVALAGSPVKVFNQDRDLRYTWVYNLQEGWTEKEYLGKTDEEIFDPADAARMTGLKRRVLESGRGAREEITITARGRTYYCDLTVEPLLDAAGSVVGVNCACGDVTNLREIMEELRLAKERLTEENLYLEQSIDTELGFGEIVGKSKALKSVMQHVGKVAPSEATVLVLGETGTGKELVARAIHRMSSRQGGAFIKMNCAAIPSGLLESELFGHEKGAFTGAVSRKVGRLELADRGTLFLDEIGEIPIELQPKLLRVLQDHEFERLGGTQTLKVNFRLIAATNRDLLHSVQQHQFRSDLYYRLNVFPIHVPALRERREDISLLVEHFVQHYAARMSKSITTISKKTMDLLVGWDWPGNIRELENFVERSVILTHGTVLQVPLAELNSSPKTEAKSGAKESEREQILRALRDSRGQLGGPDGAAARLGLKRTTLESKLKQLGIRREEYRR